MPAATLPNGVQGDESGETLGDFIIIDDLFKARANDRIQKPLLAFPRSERGVSDFELFSGQDLDRFVEHAAKYYLQAGLRTTHDSRVALLGPTTIEWVVTLFGLLRAGFAVVTLSPRISAQAVASLMSATHCESVICAVTPQTLRTLDQVKGRRDIQATPILSRACTEVGLVGTSSDREAGDKDWAYIRIPQPRMEHIWPRYVGENQFEFIFLKDYPSRVESNSDDPPQSFYSKDIFSPHPTVPNAWKYLGRIDDRVTLTNGEKVLPLPIEGRVRQQPLVREAVVFGVARPIPGLLAFRSETARALPDEEFVDRIWLDVEAANQTAEAFSQIAKDMVVPLPADAEYPQTDKGSFIRPQMYQSYEKEINEAYSRLEGHQEGALRLNIPQLEEHLLTVGRQLVGQQLEDKTTDFFTAGMDSLRALQMRGMIIKELDLGGKGKHLSQNIVFETSNVEELAKHLYKLSQGQLTPEAGNAKAAMQAMIEKYSVFKKHSPGSKAFAEQPVVVLTGATGGLGSQILSKLSLNPSVSKVYCLLRGADPLARLRTSLADRKLEFDASKTIALTSDLSDPTLGLDETTYAEVKSSATHIIHAAWPVNFQLALTSFEPHIRGLHNLLQLSLSSPYRTPARLLFCSSVSTALGTPAPAKIPEAIIEDLDHASDMGYGRSKLVGEHVVAAAVERFGAQASVLRIGQVAGDTRYGMWNDTEAIPSVVRGALTMGMLPEAKIRCVWLPVDILADIVFELGGIGSGAADCKMSP
ncbi:MAG: hypothetical protein L6R39_002393 [Caloplaca ligustica]|nr:MAG: hypothetical protein L6R39_002393 [Caloplaca ligustica]